MSKAERTRSFIIEKAAPIVNRKGIAGTSITDIMEATQLAKGGIYGNFESKEEICGEALDYLLCKTQAAMQQRMAGLATSKERLFAMFDYYEENLLAEGNYGCPMMNFGVESDDTDASIRQRVSKAIVETEQTMRSLLQEGVEKGEFVSSLDARAVALRAFTMIEGGMWMCRVIGNKQRMREIVTMLKKEIEGYES
jgi:AcrR family transcriptional regulator